MTFLLLFYANKKTALLYHKQSLEVVVDQLIFLLLNKLVIVPSDNLLMTVKRQSLAWEECSLLRSADDYAYNITANQIVIIVYECCRFNVLKQRWTQP